MAASNASIVFGAFNVGVALTKVMDDKNGTPALKTLHSVCMTPINEQKVCSHCDRPVLADEVMKGFVQSKNHIIPLTLEEVESAKTPRSSVIELVKFVDPLESVWIERSYWAEAKPLSERASYLLSKALSRSGLWGLGTGAIWGKERPYAIEGTDALGLVLHVLHTAQELTPHQLPSLVDVSDLELEMMEKLVNSWSAPLEEDDLTVIGDGLLRSLIAAKIEGNEFVPPVEVVEPPLPPDLMEAMKATIAMKKSRRTKKVPA